MLALLIILFILIIFAVAIGVNSQNKTDDEESDEESGNKTALNTILNNKKESIRQIDKYEYRGKIVYLLTRDMCSDCFEELYDSQGNYMGAPSGGITGRGDGKFLDFNAAEFIDTVYQIS